jgi:TonB family protein
LTTVSLLTGGWGRAANAQKPGAAVSCDSILSAARVDSVEVTARAYLVRRDEELLPPKARAVLIENVIAQFVAPKPLELRVFGPGPMRTRMLRPESDDSLTRRAPMLYGVYNFTLRRSGPTTAAVAVSSLVPAFDSSIVRAITAGTDTGVTNVARALDVDSLPLQLRISTGPEDPRFRVPALTMFAATFPVVRLVDAKPTGVVPLPNYPEDERDDGRDGEAVLRAVVDVTGAVNIATIEVQHATSPAFALSAARTLARYQFTPAHVGRCAVPQVVEIPFWFSLRP